MHRGSFPTRGKRMLPTRKHADFLFSAGLVSFFGLKGAVT